MYLYQMGRSGGPAYPNRLTGKMDLYPVLVREGGPVIRGKLPGLFHPAHGLPASHLATVYGEGDNELTRVIIVPAYVGSTEGWAALQIEGEPM